MFVDEAQRNGQITYKQEDKVAAVRELVNILALEPLIAVFTRLIASSNRIKTCAIRISQDISALVLRFCRLVPDHFIHGGVAKKCSSHINPFTLLNNLNFSVETLCNAKL